jgi:hypothetical protein
MKNLKDILEASVLGDIDTRIDNMDDETIKVTIREFVDRTYFCRQHIAISAKPNKDGKYVLTASAAVNVRDQQIEYLTNGMFVWGTVYGSFDCSHCENLKSLEGSPKEVQGYFSCNRCTSLKSLENGPKRVSGPYVCSECDSLESLKGCAPTVNGYFNCSRCANLKSLKYSPKQVHDFIAGDCYSIKDLVGVTQNIKHDFTIDRCRNLKSLKGCPENIPGSFSCYACKSLKSLDYMPKTIGSDFECSNCGERFDDSYIESKCKVRGTICNDVL